MIDLRLGHTLERLRELPDESVQCIVTSPPYWGLRAYGTDPQVWLNGHEPCAVHQWGEPTTTAMEYVQGNPEFARPHREKKSFTAETNICSLCGAWRGELGLEPTPALYVAHMTQIFREARRVLKGDGTLWLNLGDSYSTGADNQQSGGIDSKRAKDVRVLGTSETSKWAKHRKVPEGLKPKDLVGIPWRVAFALQADGWYLRQDIIWAKPNPMPESVRDRCTKAHEYVFLMSKSPRYYYDADAVRERHATKENRPDGIIRNRIYEYDSKENALRGRVVASEESKSARNQDRNDSDIMRCGDNPNGRNKRSVWTVTTHPFKEAHFATFPPKLIEPMILAGCPVGGTVLDPFNGSGTTGLVAVQLGRNYIGVELKPEYVEMTKRRLESVQMKATGER